ncbi:hypothetical protein ACRRTK_015462 [Alexandromys fortis]
MTGSYIHDKTAVDDMMKSIQYITTKKITSNKMVWVALLSGDALSSNRIFYAGAFTNVSESKQIKVTKFCSLFSMNYIIRALILTVATSRDVVLVGLMLASSAYMVIILLRHQRQHKHLHSLSHLRASPEKRATQTILLLVVSFVVMYWVDFIISSISVLLWMYNPVILSVQKIVMNVYPTITPLVQISSDNRIINTVKHMQSMCHQIFKKR